MNIKQLPVFIMFSLPLFVAADSYQGSGFVIEGPAQVSIANLYECENGRSRPSPLGVKISDEKQFTVPADVQYKEQNFVNNLYDQCSGVTPKSLDDVDISAVPVIEIDPDGEVITGYIFADNYFEMYINGKLIGVDPVPFTPFNSNIVRFQVKKPYDIAIMVVDWEENSGLGSEDNRGKRYHPGDGGLIASFSDGTITNADWSAQTFYTSPIYDLSCVEEKGEQRLTDKCKTDGHDEYVKTVSIHWDIPMGWEFNESHLDWPKAVTYSEDEIGVNNKNAYMNFQQQFSGVGAEFIWSSNVVLDNLVLFKYTVE